MPGIMQGAGRVAVNNVDTVYSYRDPGVAS